MLTTNKLIQIQLTSVNQENNKAKGYPLIFRLLAPLLIIVLFLASPKVSSNNLQIESALSTKHAWQREQVIVMIEVKTDDPFGRLQIDNFKQKGFTIIPLGKQITGIKKGKYYALTQRWAIFPFVAGEYQLQFPRVRYRPSRGSIKTLDIPTLSLEVKPLPIYVPATMPVGKIELQNTWETGRIVTSNTLLYWNVTVTGTHVAKQTLPRITRQIKTQASIDFLPIKHTQQSEVNAQGVIHQVEYKIPLKAKEIGKLDLPILAVQYFNPSSGKLENIKIYPRWTVVLSQWVYALMTFIGIILLTLTFRILMPKIKHYRRRTVLKKQSLKQLEEAINHQQILKALQQLSISQGWNKPLTLREFVKTLNKSLNTPPNSKKALDLKLSIDLLEKDMFAPYPLNMVQSSLTALTNEIRHRL